MIDPDAMATDKQHSYLHVLMRDYGWSMTQVVGCAYELFEIDVISDLSRLQLSQLIGRILEGPVWIDPRQQRLGI